MTASPDYSQAVADIIDGLGDDPTPDAVYHATRAYDVNYLAAAAASEAKAAGGGGGSQSGENIPTANTDGVTVDSTTYDDPIAGGGAKLTTLVFTEDQGAVAFAIDGDDFPRLIMPSDPTDAVLYMGDGTIDPTNGPHMVVTGGRALRFYGGQAGGTMSLGLDPGANRFNGGLRIETGIDFGSGAPRVSGGGDPNLLAGGEVGDFYFRNDTPTTPNQRIYVCTVAGTPGAATWVGIL